MVLVKTPTEKNNLKTFLDNTAVEAYTEHVARQYKSQTKFTACKFNKIYF
jgi:hypothetical protein